MNIADRLKKARSAKDWSQETLADKVGCGQSIIGNLESGQQQWSKWLPAIADALGVDLKYLTKGAPAQSKADKFRAELLHNKTTDPYALIDQGLSLLLIVGTDKDNILTIIKERASQAQETSAAAINAAKKGIKML